MRQLDAPDPRPRCWATWCTTRVELVGEYCAAHAGPDGGEECDDR